MPRRLAILMSYLLLTSCASRVVLTQQAPPTLGSEPQGYESAVVERVVDGDTLEVRITGRVAGPGAGDASVGEVYDVRLIGIDTPESVAPGRPVECFGPEASAAAEVLLGRRDIRLVKDVEETDSFGRLLRYVYLGAEMANGRLVVNGYALSYRYPPNTRHAGLLASLERFARSGDKGLWAPSACEATPRAGF